jgi:hypothetical protein
VGVRPSAGGREEHTHRTNKLVTNKVHTQLIDPIGIVIFGSCTTDAHRFNDSTPVDDDDDDDDVYLNKLQPKVLQNLWSEYMNNADQPIWHE